MKRKEEKTEVRLIDIPNLDVLVLGPKASGKSTLLKCFQQKDM